VTEESQAREKKEGLMEQQKLRKSSFLKKKRGKKAQSLPRKKKGKKRESSVSLFYMSVWNERKEREKANLYYWRSLDIGGGTPSRRSSSAKAINSNETLQTNAGEGTNRWERGEGAPLPAE